MGKTLRKLVNRTKPWSGPGPWISLCIIEQTHSSLCQSWCWYLVYLYHAGGVQRDATLLFLNWYPSITALQRIILLIWSDLGGITRQNFCLLSILEQNFMRSSTITTGTLSNGFCPFEHLVFHDLTDWVKLPVHDSPPALDSPPPICHNNHYFPAVRSWTPIGTQNMACRSADVKLIVVSCIPTIKYCLWSPPLFKVHVRLKNSL